MTSFSNLVHTIYQLIVFVLDVSPSMTKSADPAYKPPIEDLMKQLAQFYKEISEITHCAVHIMVITFAEDVKVEGAFEPVQGAVPPTLVTRGDSTNLGGAIGRALDEVLAHREYLKSTGMEVKQPWLVVFTDGQPNMSSCPGFDTRLIDLINRGKCVFLPIAVGGYASYEELERLSPKQKPIVVSSSAPESVSFAQFFRFLSQSIASGQLPDQTNLQQNHE